MAERMEVLHGKVASLAGDVTDKLADIIEQALPTRTKLHEAQEAWRAAKASGSKQISKAAALFTIIIRESILQLFPDSEPDNVHEDSFKSQWRIIRDRIVTRQVGKKADKKVREAAEKAVNRLQGLWSAAQRVCRNARADKLAQWKKNGHPNLQQAYRDLLAKDREGKAPSADAMARVLKTVNAWPVESVRQFAHNLEGVKLAQETVAAIAKAASKAKAAKQLPKRVKAPNA